MNCYCDSETFGSHSSACYDMKLKATARTEERWQAELIDLRAQIAAVKAVIEKRRYDDWWVETQIMPELDKALTQGE